MTNESGGGGGGQPSGWDKLWNMVLNAPWGAMISIVVVVGSMLFVAQVIGGDGSKALDIRDTEFARGFITVLFGVGTIGIALLVTLSAIFMTDANAKERFDRGKEVLSMLLGIFGTIIGFYYGTNAAKNPVSNQQQTTQQEAGKQTASTKPLEAAKPAEAGKPPEAGKAPEPNKPDKK